MWQSHVYAEIGYLASRSAFELSRKARGRQRPFDSTLGLVNRLTNLLDPKYMTYKEVVAVTSILKRYNPNLEINIGENVATKLKDLLVPLRTPAQIGPERCEDLSKLCLSISQVLFPKYQNILDERARPQHPHKRYIA